MWSNRLRTFVDRLGTAWTPPKDSKPVYATNEVRGDLPEAPGSRGSSPSKANADGWSGDGMWLGGLFGGGSSDAPIGTKLNEVFGATATSRRPEGSAAHVQPVLQQIVVLPPPAAAPAAPAPASSAAKPAPAAPVAPAAPAAPSAPTPVAVSQAPPVSASAAAAVSEDPRQPLLSADSAKADAEPEGPSEQEQAAARIIEKAARKRMTTSGTVGGRQPLKGIAAKRELAEDEDRHAGPSVLSYAMLGCLLSTCVCLIFFGAVGAPVAVALEDTPVSGISAVQHSLHQLDETLHLVGSD